MPQGTASMVFFCRMNYLKIIPGKQIPGGFKEHFIKYDDNPQDDTVILFDSLALHEMEILIELSVDFINDYFFEGTASHYLESNVDQRMLDKADTEEKKKRIQALYPHWAKNSE